MSDGPRVLSIRVARIFLTVWVRIHRVLFKFCKCLKTQDTVMESLGTVLTITAVRPGYSNIVAQGLQVDESSVPGMSIGRAFRAALN
jgi:hypothetical protein